MLGETVLQKLLLSTTFLMSKLLKYNFLVVFSSFLQTPLFIIFLLRFSPQKITLQYGCSPVNLLHIFRTPFLKNTSGWLLLKLISTDKFSVLVPKSCFRNLVGMSSLIKSKSPPPTESLSYRKRILIPHILNLPGGNESFSLVSEMSICLHYFLP